MTTALNQLPAPLTPADCNLQDFAFMPLDVARLRDSDMAAYESPEACWAAVLLWSAAWHQVPAASLPDDDRFLAKAAGYGRVVKEWANVRDGALHGWIKCADGRLYHPVVAEKALESWKAKVHHQWKKECDRVRKSNKQRESEGRPLLPLPPEPGSVPDGIPQESPRIPLESDDGSSGNPEAVDGNPPENALKGQGEGQGQGEYKNPESSSQASTEARENDDSRIPPLPTNRNVQIALLLRAQGVLATAQHPTVCVTWAQNPKVTDDVLNIAIAKAKTAKGDKPVPLAYLVPIVEQELQAQDAPPQTPASTKPRESWEWKRTPGGIEAKGRELGMFARGTENHADFAKRIEAELEKRKGAQP
jgi:hypothetical protein